MKLNVELLKKAKEIYKNEPSGHDIFHIKRVLNFAKKINKQEGGDWFIIYTSILFHDIHRVIQSKTGEYITPSECIKEVKDILKGFNLKKSQLEKVLYIIENHERKREKFNKTKELKIVQDADMLDTLGKVGLKRCLKYCKKHNIPKFDNRYDLNCNEYVPDINPISACHYIYRTMLTNIDYLNTKTAKDLGIKQVKILKNFINKNIKKSGL